MKFNLEGTGKLLFKPAKGQYYHSQPKIMTTSLKLNFLTHFIFHL